MNRKEAIEYLERKDKLLEKPLSAEDVKKHNEEEIKKVMSQGKIYGDPLVDLDA